MGILRDLIQIDVYRDYVMIDKTRVDRPARISPSQWISYWEQRR